MEHVSKPLIAVLVATVAFFALWVVALKPGGSSSGGSPTKGLGAYQNAINAAHQAVQTSTVAANAAAGNTATAPAAATSAPVSAVHSRAVSTSKAAKPATHHRPRSSDARPVSPAARLAVVQGALSRHKVLALLFYNPSAPDDQAVKQELASVGTHGGRVVKLAIPLDELTSYLPVIDQLPVNFSPTLVVVAPNRDVGQIVGFADPFEISQRIDDALAVKP